MNIPRADQVDKTTARHINNIDGPTFCELCGKRATLEPCLEIRNGFNLERALETQNIGYHCSTGDETFACYDGCPE